MVTKHIFGKPIPTGAVVQNISETSTKPRFITVSADERSFVCPLSDSDVVYGLGEQVRGINKRGWRYENYCADDPLHLETKRSLYGAHNFIVVDGEQVFGAFFDFGGWISFDIGAANPHQISVQASDDLTLYIIDGETAEDVIKQFRALIGQSYIPPFWAFGYQQSRWGYRDEQDVLAVADGFLKNEIPLDAIYLDIDYMERYKSFSVDKERFPDLAELVKKLKKKGIRLVPIIDAGIKIEEGYDVCEEGKANGYFCKRADGSDFVAGVWPGKTHFTDFFDEKASAWFGDNYAKLLKLGIEGFWNDMNEPAIFYSEETLEQAIANYDRIMQSPLDVNGFFELTGVFGSLSGNHNNYDLFFHSINGEKIPHRRVHNLYGYLMTKSAADAFDRLLPNKRVLIFSRSSYIGMHRCGGIWTGDNQSWWSHLLLNIKMMPSLSMCGFLYSGADLGGFGADTTGDLLLRWLQFGLFTPLMRNHSAHDTREQEPFRFDNLPLSRELIRLRYRLVPFLYSELVQRALQGEMLFKPLAFGYRRDKRAREIEDQILLGDNLMLTPVYEQNANGRHVYLPEQMLKVTFASSTEYSCEILPQGDHYIHFSPSELVFFLLPNTLLPLAEPAPCTDKINGKHLTVLCFAEEGKTVSYTLYSDDGFGKDYSSPANYSKITVTNGEVTTDGELEITVDIY